MSKRSTQPSAAGHLIVSGRVCAATVGVRNSQQRLEGLRRGRISKADAQEFLNSLGDLNIHLTDPLSYGAVFEIAERHSLTVYDAAYLELAIRERLALASLDAALIRAARKEQVAIF